MFYVVEFSNHTIEVIPSSWLLENEKECYWPPGSNHAVQRAIRKAVAPNPNWKTSQIVKIRKNCATFDIANKKAEKLMDTSDLSTTDAEFARDELQKRVARKTVTYSPEPRRSPRKHPEAAVKSLATNTNSVLDNHNLPDIPSFSDSQNRVVLGTEKSPGIRMMSSMSHSVAMEAPSRDQDISFENHTVSECQIRDLPNNSTDKSTEVQRTSPKKRPPAVRTSTPNMNSVQDQDRIPVTGHVTPRNSSDQSGHLKKTASSETVVTGSKQFGLIINKLNRMDEKLDLLSRKVHMAMSKGVCGSATGTSHDDIPQLPQGIDLPADNLKDMKAYASRITTNSSERRSVTRYLSVNGSTTLSDTVCGIMKALMRNSLALQFNWVGSRGKQSFYNLQLSPVICDAVRMNNCTSTSNNKEIEDKVKAWLRQARDRDGGRKRRYEVAARRANKHIDHLSDVEDDSSSTSSSPNV